MLSDLRKFLSKRQREYRRQERIRTLQEQSAAEKTGFEFNPPSREKAVKEGGQ